MIIIYGHLQEMQEIEKLILIHLNSEVGPVDVQYFGHKLFSSLPGKTFFLCRDYGKHEKKNKGSVCDLCGFSYFHQQLCRFMFSCAHICKICIFKLNNTCKTV